MAAATSHGYLHYPPPAVYMGNMRRGDRLNLAAELPLMPLPLFPSPPMTITDSRQQLQNGGTSLEPSVQHVFRANATEQFEQLMPSSIPMSNTHNTVNGSFANQNSASDMDISSAEDVHGTRLNQLGQDPLRDRIRWELPFMQGWLMGHRAGTPSSLPLRGSPHKYLVSSERGSTSLAPEPANTNQEYPEVSLDMPFNMNPVEFYLQNGPTNESNNMGDPIPMITQI